MRFLNYSSFFENRKRPETFTIFTDGKSQVEMTKPDYLALLASETMSETDFSKLENKLKSISKIIGFDITTMKERINYTNFFKYKITVNCSLTSVKGSFLDLIVKIKRNLKLTSNRDAYFSYNEMNLLKETHIWLGPKLLGMSSTPDAQLITSNSINIAHKEIMNHILQKLISCHGPTEFEMVLPPEEFDIPDLKVHILSLIGANMSLSTKATLNEPAKAYLNDAISHSSGFDYIEYMKTNNPLLYKAYTKGEKKAYTKSKDMYDKGFGD